MPTLFFHANAQRIFLKRSGTMVRVIEKNQYTSNKAYILPLWLSVMLGHLQIATVSRKAVAHLFIKDCVLEEGDSAGRVLHDYFIELRDKIYAHTDSTHHALRLTSHVYDDDVTIGDIETIPDLCVTANKLTSFNEMTENMIHNLSERLKQLKETAPIIRHDETWT